MSKNFQSYLSLLFGWNHLKIHIILDYYFFITHVLQIRIIYTSSFQLGFYSCKFQKY